MTARTPTGNVPAPSNCSGAPAGSNGSLRRVSRWQLSKIALPARLWPQGARYLCVGLLHWCMWQRTTHATSTSLAWNPRTHRSAPRSPSRRHASPTWRSVSAARRATRRCRPPRRGCPSRTERSAAQRGGDRVSSPDMSAESLAKARLHLIAYEGGGGSRARSHQLTDNTVGSVVVIHHSAGLGRASCVLRCVSQPSPASALGGTRTPNLLISRAAPNVRPVCRRPSGLLRSALESSQSDPVCPAARSSVAVQ